MKKGNKSKAYVVYGGKWNIEENQFNDINEIKNYTVFKNREKAEEQVDKLLDGYMKMKSYSMKYTIENSYEADYEPIKTFITNITDKKGDIVFSAELKEIDLSNIIL